MNDIIKELATELLKESHPIIRVRMNMDIHHSITTKGNFKRAIQIGGTIYRISNNHQKYQVMHQLSNIICRIFNISQEESIPTLKAHLHIK